jgi:hypothetical protein
LSAFKPPEAKKSYHERLVRMEKLAPAPAVENKESNIKKYGDVRR